MPLDRMPPEVDENNIKESVRNLYEYLFYLREQMVYELDLIKKENGGKSDGVQ